MNYLVCVGGTGARVLESVIYLSACGVFTKPLYVLLIDPDQSNGNAKRTSDLITLYQKLWRHRQSHNLPVKSSGLSHLYRSFVTRGRMTRSEPSFFKTRINLESDSANRLLRWFWENPNPADSLFSDVIEFDRQPEGVRDFVSLFFGKRDLSTRLDKGFLGRPNLGALALNFYLGDTATVEGTALKDLTAQLGRDLASGEVRFCVVGSLFGGSGAAALAAIPTFMNSLPAEIVGQSRQNILYGCVMLGPYFAFPQKQTVSSLESTVQGRVPEAKPSSPATLRNTMPDSHRHLIATKAALFHYAHVPSLYQNIWLTGAPELHPTSEVNAEGGERQANNSHYAELVAALAVQDCFSMQRVNPDECLVHFADDVRTIKGVRTPMGVQWDALPFSPVSEASDRRECRRAIVNLATFSFLYHNYMHEEITIHKSHRAWAWYRDNFSGDGAPLHADSTALADLDNFSSGFLNWLNFLGRTLPTPADGAGLFRWEAFSSRGTDCNAYAANLIPGSPGDVPRYVADGYHQIMRHLNGLRLQRIEGDPLGRFVYLLSRAADEFCSLNYPWL